MSIGGPKYEYRGHRGPNYVPMVNTLLCTV